MIFGITTLKNARFKYETFVIFKFWLFFATVATASSKFYDKNDLEAVRVPTKEVKGNTHGESTWIIRGMFKEIYPVSVM